MDQTQLKQKISSSYFKLPLKLQQFFSDMKWMEDLNVISSKYLLNEKQIETLGTETTLLLLGLVNKQEYKDTLKKDLNITPDAFDSLINDLESTLFTNILSEIDEAYEINIDSILDEKYGGDKKLDERFASLPKEVQLAITESNYQIALYNIASQYTLNIEQMGALEEVTTKVMLGITNPDKYQDELSLKLGVAQEESDNIVRDVNEKILKAIIEILKKHWSKNNITEDRVPIPPYIKNIPENKPMAQAQPNILEEKLIKPVVSGDSTSVHKPEIKKETTDGSHDPYREII